MSRHLGFSLAHCSGPSISAESPRFSTCRSAPANGSSLGLSTQACEVAPPRLPDFLVTPAKRPHFPEMLATLGQEFRPIYKEYIALKVVFRMWSEMASASQDLPQHKHPHLRTLAKVAITLKHKPRSEGNESPGGPSSRSLRPHEASVTECFKPRSETDELGVPWFTSSCAQPSFGHKYFVPKAVCEDGLYGANMIDGKVDYHFNLEIQWQSEFDRKTLIYPQPSFDRRLTLNNWRTTLVECLGDAALRLTNLLANFQLAFSMFDSESYNEVPDWIKFTFSGLLSVAILLWVILGVQSQRTFIHFIHPDTRFQRAYAFVSAVILDMFAIPKDVTLLPLHFIPCHDGGLLQESGHIFGEKDWPVHTICHQNKLDHDYVNTSGSSVQLPLFVLVDICCSIINVSVSFTVQIFNYTVLLQVASSFAYSFLKIRLAVERFNVRRNILELWLKTACDPRMKQFRREHAVQKYLGAGGNKRRLEEAVSVSGLGDRHSQFE